MKFLTQLIRKGKTALLIGVGLGLVIGYNACSQNGFTGSGASAVQLGSSQAVGQSQVKMSLSILDTTNATVYTDSIAAESLTLKSATNYFAFIQPSAGLSSPSGASINILLTPISVANGTTVTVPAQFGTQVALPQFQTGQYTVQLVENAPSMVQVSQTYQASVICPSPTLTAAGTSASITASLSSQNNVFNYTVSNLVANGMAPYFCALDPTGTGILDTAFQPCSQVFNQVYNNYVASRNVAVMVRDACNIAVPVYAQVNFPYTIPAPATTTVAAQTGVNFIFGQFTGATESAQNDSRVNNVSYFATNESVTNSSMSSNASNTQQVVLTDFNQDTTGVASAFDIHSWFNYGMTSSVNLGMAINLSNISGTVNFTTGASTLSATNAKISSVQYTTDQAGDVLPSMAFSGTNCTLSNQGIQALFVAGSPCTSSDGSKHTGGKFTIEMWGSYSCNSLTTSGGTVNVKGTFDGMNLIVDSCSGGGGGGGGIPPISL